jgi:DtxR family manganese transport transcriptional regulator
LDDGSRKIAGEPGVAEQAEGFRRSREARRNALTEDYVEMIADLISTAGEARSVDLACRFGVTQATVAKMVSRLKREGLVRAERYGSLNLTKAGTDLACHARRRHQTVVDFLKRIGVAPEIAERDAEGIEHHVSDETLEAFARLRV